MGMYEVEKDTTLTLTPLMLSRLKHFVGYAAFCSTTNTDAEELYAVIMRQCNKQEDDEDY